MLELVLYVSILLGAFYLSGVVCDRFFVPTLDEIADRFQLSPDIVGGVFMAGGSSAPELFIMMFSLFMPGNTEDIGVGTIVGSGMFNALVLIGLSIMVRRSAFTWQPVARDLVFYSLALVVMFFVFRDGMVTVLDAALLVGVYVLYLVGMKGWKRLFPYKTMDYLQAKEDVSEDITFQKSNPVVTGMSYIIPDVIRYPKLYWASFLMSLVALAGLSYMLVESVVRIAELASINPTLIALSVVAIGSSVPDTISSIIVSRQGKSDMIMSNAIGSNTFDITIAIGFPLLLYFLMTPATSIEVDSENLVASVILLFSSIIAILAMLILRRWTIGFKTGLVLLSLYAMYIIYIIYNVV